MTGVLEPNAATERSEDVTALAHHRWCVFFDDSNILECHNRETGSMDCEGPLLTVPLTIEGQEPVKVSASASADVPAPYIWLGRVGREVACQSVAKEGTGPDIDIWLTPEQATTLGHYLLATAAMIKSGAAL